MNDESSFLPLILVTDKCSYKFLRFHDRNETKICRDPQLKKRKDKRMLRSKFLVKTHNYFRKIYFIKDDPKF